MIAHHPRTTLTEIQKNQMYNFKIKLIRNWQFLITLYIVLGHCFWKNPNGHSIIPLKGGIAPARNTTSKFQNILVWHFKIKLKEKWQFLVFFFVLFLKSNQSTEKRYSTRFSYCFQRLPLYLVNTEPSACSLDCACRSDFGRHLAKSKRVLLL